MSVTVVLSVRRVYGYFRVFTVLTVLTNSVFSPVVLGGFETSF